MAGPAHPGTKLRRPRAASWPPLGLIGPDGRRIAFKRAIDADPAKGWRLSVLDLPTMRVRPTAESPSPLT